MQDRIIQVLDKEKQQILKIKLFTFTLWDLGSVPYPVIPHLSTSGPQRVSEVSQRPAAAHLSIISQPSVPQFYCSAAASKYRIYICIRWKMCFLPSDFPGFLVIFAQRFSRIILFNMTESSFILVLCFWVTPQLKQSAQVQSCSRSTQRFYRDTVDTDVGSVQLEHLKQLKHDCSRNWFATGWVAGGNKSSEQERLELELSD